MRKLLTSLMLLIVFSWCLPNSLAQPRRRKRDAVFIGGGAATGARHRGKRKIGAGVGGAVGGIRERNTGEPGDYVLSSRTNRKGAIGAGGAGTYIRNGRRGRWIIRNGQRIWVPQGSPAKNNNANR